MTKTSIVDSLIASRLLDLFFSQAIKMFNIRLQLSTPSTQTRWKSIFITNFGF